MATVTDSLETILELRGAAIYIAEMTAASGATTLLGRAQSFATATTTALSAAITAAGGRLAIIGAAIAALSALITAATRAFGGAQEQIVRTAIVLRNMGSSIPLDMLRDLGSELQRVAAVDDDLIVSLGGVLARFGVAGEQIPEALKAITDASAATGLGLEEMAQTFARGLIPGSSRRLRRLGIEFEATGDRVADATRLMDEFNKRFGGAGAVLANTIPGRFRAIGHELSDLFENLGRLFEPVVLPLLNQVLATLQLLNRFLGQFISELERAGYLAPIAPEIGTPGASAAFAGDEALDELKGIRKNTDKTNSTLQQALGGGGSAAAGAFAIRNLNAGLRAAF